MDLAPLIYNEIIEALNQSYEIKPFVDIDDMNEKQLIAKTNQMEIEFCKRLDKCMYPYDISIRKNHQQIRLKIVVPQKELSKLYDAAQTRYNKYFKESTEEQKRAYKLLLDSKANQK